MTILANSLTEPSSWAGLAAIAGQIGPLLGLPSPVTGAVVGLCGLAAWMLRERGGAAPKQ